MPATLDVETRLSRLERQNRLLRLVVALFCGLLLMGQGGPEATKVVRAQRFELVDAGGTVLARLGRYEPGAFGRLPETSGWGLVLFVDDRPTAALGVSPATGASSLMLLDTAARRGLGLSTEVGSHGIFLAESAGKPGDLLPRAALELPPGGTGPALNLYDDRGYPSATFGHFESRLRPGLLLSAGDGQPIRLAP